MGEEDLYDYHEGDSGGSKSNIIALVIIFIIFIAVVFGLRFLFDYFATGDWFKFFKGG